MKKTKLIFNILDRILIILMILFLFNIINKNQKEILYTNKSNNMILNNIEQELKEQKELFIIQIEIEKMKYENKKYN